MRAAQAKGRAVVLATMKALTLAGCMWSSNMVPRTCLLPFGVFVKKKKKTVVPREMSM